MIECDCGERFEPVVEFRHRVICGDSTDREIIKRLVGDDKIDCTVTDPPYGVGIDYASFDDTREGVKELIERFMPIVFDYLPAALTPGIPMMWDYPRPAWVGAWVHPAPMSGCPWGFVGNNPILFYGNDPYLKAGKGRRPDSIVLVADRQGMVGHPSPKPMRVWMWLVERITPKINTIIFDPFLGSGTTMSAAHQLGRRCFGCEIHPPYVSVVLQRWLDLTGSQPELIKAVQ